MFRTCRTFRTFGPRTSFGANTGLSWLSVPCLGVAHLVDRSHNNSHNSRGSRYETVAALRATAMVVAASCGVVAVIVAAADDTRHAEARRAKPSQASQSREGLANDPKIVAWAQK